MSATHSPRTAVLVCDLQNGILDSQFNNDQAAIEAYVERCNSVIHHARELGHLLIFIRVAFRPGHPEASENNKVRYFSTRYWYCCSLSNRTEMGIASRGILGTCC